MGWPYIITSSVETVPLAYYVAVSEERRWTVLRGSKYLSHSSVVTFR